MFPKNIMIGEEFKLYRKAFCRTLNIKAKQRVKTYGVDTIQFELVDDAFDDSMNDTESSCFCAKRGSCMRKGLGYAGSCYFSKNENEQKRSRQVYVAFFEQNQESWSHSFLIPAIPIAVSLPHFYKSDPRLADEIEGMKPEQEKHETIVQIEPVR